MGTFSCHGMEPVYESDYYSSSSSSEEECENDEQLDDNNNNGRVVGGGIMGSGGSNQQQPIRNSSPSASPKKKKQTSTAKINQDRGGITYPYANSTSTALFAVYDGHGEGGELVSQYALGEVQRLLEEKLLALLLGRNSSSSVIGGGGGLKGIAEEDDEEEDDDSPVKDTPPSPITKQQQRQEEEEEEEQHIIQSMKKVFTTVDRGLLKESDIEPMYSGTTACVVLLRENKLYISNCGDSRAVLAQRKKRSAEMASNGVAAEDDDDEAAVTSSSSNNLTTKDLSTDQNPDSPGEKERILSSGGFVSPPPEPGLSSRVWLDASHTQIGLAMARSIGDHAVKGVGVIAEPVVTIHEINEEEDEFIVIATDGVWEFISSEDAVEIVSKHLYDTAAAAAAADDDDTTANTNDNGDEKSNERPCGGASVACEALIKAASDKWHEHEGDYRDDITAIVIRLKDLWR